MKIVEIISPEQEYRIRKGELERLRASDPLTRHVEYMKSTEDDRRNWGRDDPRWEDYDRKKTYYDKLRKIHHRRWYDMTKNVDHLRGQVVHNKYKHLPTGMFVTYDTQPGVESPAYIDPVGQMIDQSNDQLEYPASEAITRFVGHAHPMGSSEWGAGAWSEKWLEDAYSANPSQQGYAIRQQLEAAMAPIRQELKSRFGNILTLYRSQRSTEPNDSERNVLSWTASQKFSQFHGGDQFRKIEAQIPIDDIIWITNRTNQQEFIIRNRRNTKHYLGLS